MQIVEDYKKGDKMKEDKKYGKAEINPQQAYAGQKGCWEIEYITGSLGIKEGGGLRIIPPHRGTVLWKIGKVIAFSDNPEVYLEVKVEKTYPLTYHHSNYPAINILVYGADLKEGEIIKVKIGALGGYNSGRFIQTKAQTHSGLAEFEVYVDPIGNANFSREKIRLSAYKRVSGKLQVNVLPSKEHHIRFSIRNRPKKESNEIGVISIEDIYENPISKYKYNISLWSEKGYLKLPELVIKDKDKNGVKFNIKASEKEISWAGASYWQKGIYGVSNPVAPNFYNGEYRVYFGDMHVMTESTGVRDMIGDTEGALRYARDVFGLDFTTVTNIVNLKYWPTEQKLFHKYNKDYEFITLPGYEIPFSTGHKNVFYLNENLPACNPKNPEELWKFLSDRKDAVMVISHHPNTHSETDIRNWGPLKISTINPEYEKLIEICQNRGSFEKDEIGEEVSFGGFGSSIRDILARGYKLGFVGGTDTHRGRPGSPLSNQSGLDARANVTGGITGVLAKELTRESIWEALLARRCYATTSVKILLDFRLNNLIMGEEIDINRQNLKEFSNRKIRIKTAGTYEINRVVVVRNGREVYEKKVGAMETEIEWIDKEPLERVVGKDIFYKGIYYYVKIYQDDRNMAWSSPIWLNFK